MAPAQPELKKVRSSAPTVTPARVYDWMEWVVGELAIAGLDGDWELTWSGSISTRGYSCS